MEVVVDASVLFAALVNRDTTMRLFFEKRLRPVAPIYLLEEFENNATYLADRCGLSVESFWEFMGTLLGEIDIVPVSDVSEQVVRRARDISPHAKDDAYFGLALHLGCGVWTRERDWDEQDVVRVYFTEDLVDMFLQY